MNGEEWKDAQINIREYFERINYERDKALQIQTREFERRLTELNGEAGRLREIQARYVPREVHDGKVGELEKAIRGLEIWQSNMIGRMAMVSTLAALVASAITALLMRWLGP